MELDKAVAQLGLSLSGAVVQLRMGLKNPEIDVCTMILESGLPSSKRTNKSSSPIGDGIFRTVVARLGMSLACLVGDEPFGR